MMKSFFFEMFKVFFHWHHKGIFEIIFLIRVTLEFMSRTNNGFDI